MRNLHQARRTSSTVIVPVRSVLLTNCTRICTADVSCAMHNAQCTVHEEVEVRGWPVPDHVNKSRCAGAGIWKVGSEGEVRAKFHL